MRNISDIHRMFTTLWGFTQLYVEYANNCKKQESNHYWNGFLLFVDIVVFGI